MWFYHFVWFISVFVSVSFSWFLLCSLLYGCFCHLCRDLFVYKYCFLCYFWCFSFIFVSLVQLNLINQTLLYMILHLYLIPLTLLYTRCLHYVALLALYFDHTSVFYHLLNFFFFVSMFSYFCFWCFSFSPGRGAHLFPYVILLVHVWHPELILVSIFIMCLVLSGWSWPLCY